MQDTSWNVLQVLPEAIIVIDNDRSIQYMNPAAMTLFEVSDVSEFVGKPFSVLPGGGNMATYAQRVELTNHINKFALNKLPAPERGEKQGWSAGAVDKLFDFQAIPIYDDNEQKTGFVIRVDNPTNEYSAADYLTGLPSDMFPSITAIAGYTDILLENLSHGLTDEQREIVILIKRNSQKLIKIRNAILEFTKRFFTGTNLIGPPRD